MRDANVLRVIVNGSAVEFQSGATVADVVTHVQPAQPFAVAVNMVFVPRTLHDSHILCADDQIELIVPVTGG
jgi:sulfur carrier protein